MGIESAASDDRSITCLEDTAAERNFAAAAAVGIAVAAVVAAAEEDYRGVVDVAVGGNQSWNHLKFERTRCCS